MSYRDVRKGITQASFNEKCSTLLFTEITVIAILLGVATASWWVFGITYLALIFGLVYPPVAMFLIIALSVGWAAIGAAIGSMFDSLGATVVLGVIGFVVGFGVHWSGLEWATDMNENA